MDGIKNLLTISVHSTRSKGFLPIVRDTQIKTTVVDVFILIE